MLALTPPPPTILWSFQVILRDMKFNIIFTSRAGFFALASQNLPHRQQACDFINTSESKQGCRRQISRHGAELIISHKQVWDVSESTAIIPSVSSVSLVRSTDQSESWKCYERKVSFGHSHMFFLLDCWRKSEYLISYTNYCIHPWGEDYWTKTNLFIHSDILIDNSPINTKSQQLLAAALKD